MIESSKTAEQPVGLKNKGKVFLALILPLYLLFFLAYVKGNTILWPAALAAGITAVLLLAFSFTKTSALLFAYLALFPAASWGERYLFFKGFYYNPIIAYALVAVLILWHIFDNRESGPVIKQKFPGLYPPTLMALTICFGYAMLFGLFYQTEFAVIRVEFLYLMLYLTYLFWRQRSLQELQHLWLVLIAVTIVTSMQFFMLALSEGGLTTVILGRIVTQQPHLAQITLPYLFTFFLFRSTFRSRLLAAAAALPIVIMAFLSQQRGLWGGLFISMVIAFGLYYFHKGISIKRLAQFTGIVLGSLILLLGVILIVDYLFAGSILLTLLTRIDFLANLSLDESWRIRMSEINRALSLWDNNWYTIVFGSGLGAKYPTTDWTRAYPYLVDNSFAFVLWKLGIAGLAVYVTFWFQTVSKAFRLILHDALETSHKRLITGLLAGFLGLALIGLTNGCLVQYRFIIFWAFGFAIIDRTYRDYMK